MAVRFRKNLATLVRDLGRGGFPVRLVQNVSGARGRSADLYLRNDVIVSWDPYSQTVWPEGPHQQCRKVENYLRGLYESGWLARRCFTGWYALCAAMRAPGSKVVAYFRAPLAEPRALGQRPAGRSS